jgi:uncharacterized membrane protein YfcA
LQAAKEQQLVSLLATWLTVDFGPGLMNLLNPHRLLGCSSSLGTSSAQSVTTRSTAAAGIHFLRNEKTGAMPHAAAAVTHP